MHVTSGIGILGRHPGHEFCHQRDGNRPDLGAATCENRGIGSELGCNPLDGQGGRHRNEAQIRLGVCQFDLETDHLPDEGPGIERRIHPFFEAHPG